MRRLIALVAALYPGNWREQYGREFEALLNDLKPNWRVFGNVLGGAVRMQISDGKNWLRLAVGMWVLGAIVAGGASFTVAPRYMASATVGVTPQPDPVRPLSPEALRQRALQRFAYLKEGVLSRSSLARIITGLDLYKAERSRMFLEDIDDQMRRDIRIEANQASPVVFDIAFSYPDQARAQATVRELARKFVEENAAQTENGPRRTASSGTQNRRRRHRSETVLPFSIPRAC